MNVALAAAVAAPGLALGSFLNVVAARLPAGRSLLTPRSACATCAAPIAWRDNVPLVSWALLRGRCRACGVRISPVYPAVELATAVLVVACALEFGLGAQAAIAAFFCAVLVVVSAIDLAHRIIPNRIVLPAAAICLVAQTAREPSPEWAFASLGASAFLLAAALAYPGGMGMGDVKLALLMGAVLGWAVPVALMAGMLLALLPSAVLVARHGSKARKMGIPFGPFLALGSVLALFWGDVVISWYLARM